MSMMQMMSFAKAFGSLRRRPRVTLINFKLCDKRPT